MARDAQTPPEVLAELAKSDLVFLREAVALHPRVTKDILASLTPQQLKSEADLRMGCAIASNDTTPSQFVASLLNLVDSDRVDGSRRENWPWEQLVMILLSHKNCPEPNAIAFLQSRRPSRALQCLIAERANSQALLNALLEDRSEAVQRVATKRLAQLQNLSS